MASKAQLRERVPRGARGGWAAQGGFRLVERDLAIAFTAGRLKVPTRRQLERLHFGSPHTCRDRLAKLREAGVLRVFFRALHEDNYYALTERGKTLLVEEVGVEPKDVALVRELPRQIDHLRGINDVRVELAVATRESKATELTFFLPAWELQRIANPIRFGLVPDALIGLETELGEQVVALEIDLGTEAPNFVARRKLAVYQRLIQGGVPIYGYTPDRIVLLAPGVRRLRLLANAAFAANVTDRVALGDLNNRAAQSLLTSCFASATSLAGSRAEAVPELLCQPLLPVLAGARAQHAGSVR